MAPAVESVRSRDGTAIGCRRLGRGPALVVLHGAMSSGYNHLELAERLAARFDVVLPDRRGRGLSGPYGHDHDVQKDVEDLEAVLAKTGARDLFGVSSGALIALQAALALPAIQKVALFEPPMLVGDVLSTAWLERYEDELARGDVAAALVTAMKGARMGPRLLNLLPRRLIEILTRKILAHEAASGSGEYVSMQAIAPTLRYDFRLAISMKDCLERFRSIRAEVLLVGGSKSPAYLQRSLDALQTVLPKASRVELRGLEHAAPWNRDRGGSPERVAEALLSFF
jgi:pimeloyl-ACP methyl ester carboxylesterase